MIDDFGLMELDLNKYRDLFEVLDNTYADACLTCITNKHHMCRLEMNGINMRETE